MTAAVKEITIQRKDPRQFSVHVRDVGEIFITAHAVSQMGDWFSFTLDGAEVALYQSADVIGYRIDA